MSKSITITLDRLRKLEPLSNLSDERLEELISLSYVEKLPIGVSIFREGEIDNQTIFLLDGDVQLTSSDNKIDKVISSKQEEAKYPIDDSQPRQATGIALGRTEIFRIDNSVLDYMMMWDQMAVSEEAEVEQAASTQKEQVTTQGKAEQKTSEDKALGQESHKQIEAASQPEAKKIKPAVEPSVKAEVKPEAQKEKPVAKQEAKSEAQKAKPATEQATKSEAQKTKPIAKEQSTQSKPAQPESVEDPDNPPPVPAMVTQGDEDKSWIRKMRHIMAFKNMPPANIKALLEKMETIIVNEGDVVVQQGDEGDYYYVLTEGEAKVTRMVELAELTPGSSFGEEALVSDNTRNASVTMKTSGMLMRLSKRDFNALLKEPMLSRVSPDEARSIVNKGGVWLDVRHAKEYAYSRLPKAINIPLHEVRIRLEELDKDKHYVCYCTTGRRSSAAAFLLVQRGYNVSVLNGGVQVMAQDLVK